MNTNERWPAGQPPPTPVGSSGEMSPGDQAPPGTPGTGENVCPTCGGSGRARAVACPTCDGTGTVIEAVGG
jgi:DnaJ-class molecular chaperone